VLLHGSRQLRSWLIFDVGQRKMSRFSFMVNSKAEAFCAEIVAAMRKRFDVTHDEAMKRLNQAWRGLDLTGPNEVIYHEEEAYWAATIYYGKASCWWLPEEERSRQGLPTLVPLKLPE
jgi:hypothetical protein